ncbi:unnamed protein product [Protopolystoma xenopodis]|uniref:Uncharacterized protein n=1 Tax=Protopolystoma xenopodis TaxID=117903 RepID=A0A3S5CDW7_9PLAT|nr:unnamed protein product [Protopolystoma xenopodis]
MNQSVRSTPWRRAPRVAAKQCHLRVAGANRPFSKECGWVEAREPDWRKDLGPSLATSSVWFGRRPITDRLAFVSPTPSPESTHPLLHTISALVSTSTSTSARGRGASRRPSVPRREQASRCLWIGQPAGEK